MSQGKQIRLTIPTLEEYQLVADFARGDSRTIQNLILHALRAHLSRRRKPAPSCPEEQNPENGGDPGLPVQATASRAAVRWWR